MTNGIRYSFKYNYHINSFRGLQDDACCILANNTVLKNPLSTVMHFVNVFALFVLQYSGNAIGCMTAWFSVLPVAKDAC